MSKFILFLPATFGAGEYLMAIRNFLDGRYGYSNNFVPTSITDPRYLNKSRSINDHSRLIFENVRNSNTHELTVVGYSNGILESLDLVDSILKNKIESLRKINFHFISPLWFKPYKGNQFVMKSVFSLPFYVRNMAMMDTLYAYPCSGEYPTDKSIFDGFNIIEDTEKFRQKRMALFEELENFKETKKKIENLDDKYSSGLINLGEYWGRRYRLLNPFIRELYSGHFLPDVIQQKYRYVDGVNDTCNNLEFLFSLFSFVHKHYRLLNNELVKIYMDKIRELHEAGINTETKLKFLENDVWISKSEALEILQSVKSRAEMYNLADNFKYLMFLGATHSAPGYIPELFFEDL